MVRVISPETRTRAQRGIGVLEEREKQVGKVEERARTPTALRRGFVGRKGVLQKKKLAKQIGVAREQIGVRKERLKEVVELPTKEEVVQRIKDIQRQARKARRNGIPLKEFLKGLPSEYRQVGKQAWLGARVRRIVPAPAGGMTLVTGEQVLVTPTGEAIGSAYVDAIPAQEFQMSFATDNQLKEILQPQDLNYLDKLKSSLEKQKEAFLRFTVLGEKEQIPTIAHAPLDIVSPIGGMVGEQISRVTPEKTGLPYLWGEKKGQPIPSKEFLGAVGSGAPELAGYIYAPYTTGTMLLARGYEEVKKGEIGRGALDIGFGVLPLGQLGRRFVKTALTKPKIKIMEPTRGIQPARTKDIQIILGDIKTPRGQVPFGGSGYEIRTFREPTYGVVTRPLDVFFKRTLAVQERLSEPILLGKPIRGIERAFGRQLGERFVGLGAGARTTRRKIIDYDKSRGLLDIKTKIVGRRTPIERYRIDALPATKKVPFKELSLEEKRMLKIGFEQQTGLPISLKNLEKFYGERLFLRGGVEQLSLTKPKGKRIERGEFLGLKTKKIKKEDTPDYVEFFKTEAVARDVTKPTGYVTPSKVQFMKGTGKIIDLRKLREVPSDTFFVGGKKMRISPVQKQIQKDVQKFRESFVGVKSEAVIKAQQKITKQQQRQIREKIKQVEKTEAPSVLSIQPSPSLYAGKGLYERTIGGIAPPTIGRQELTIFEPTTFKPTTLDVTPPRIKVETLDLVSDVSKERQQERERQKEIELQVEKQVEIEKQISKPKPRLDVIPREKLKTPTRLLFKLGQVPIQKQPPPPPTKIRTPTKPKIPKVPFIFGGGVQKKVKVIKKKEGKQAFEVQVKRFGKFETISKGLPKGKALKEGTKETKTTLAATFRIVPKGTTTKKDIKFKPSSQIYRQPKGKVKPPYPTFIERRGFRLSTGSEVSQIKTAKRRKRK